MPSRRLSLWEKLTWRFSTHGLKEWLVVVVAVAALVGLGLFTVRRGSVCVGEQLQLQIQLDQSDRDINALSPNEKASQCRIYGARRNLLAKLTDLLSRCGSGRTIRGSGSNDMYGRAAERDFYYSTVRRMCEGG